MKCDTWRVDEGAVERVWRYREVSMIRFGVGMDSGLSEIISSIDELASRGRISRNRAFAAWYAINFFDIDEDEALEAAAADGGNDQGIDLVFPDEATQEIVAI